MSQLNNVLKMVQEGLVVIGIPPTPPTKGCLCQICQVKVAMLTMCTLDPKKMALAMADEASKAGYTMDGPNVELPKEFLEKVYDRIITVAEATLMTPMTALLQRGAKNLS